MLHLPAASFRIYAFRAFDNWLEFSKATQTFRICCGISSNMPGSHSGGVFNSLLQATQENKASIASRHTVTIT